MLLVRRPSRRRCVTFGLGWFGQIKGQVRSVLQNEGGRLSFEFPFKYLWSKPPCMSNNCS